MSTNTAKIAARIAELERDLELEFEAGMAEKRRQFGYSVKKGRIAFEDEVCALHGKLRLAWPKFLWAAPLASLLVSPVIYALIVPLLLLDFWLWVYQAICFPVYGIAKVERSRYVALDRGHLTYLNWIERFNCDYCGYANGVVAYAREVASRTEQYFCPIKHARRSAGPHARYHEFLDFGDAKAYRAKLKEIRAELGREK